MITVQNDGTVLFCEAQGNPLPQVQWQMPNGEVVNNPSVTMIFPNDLSRANDTYTCIASNGISPVSSANMSTHQANVVVTS